MCTVTYLPLKQGFLITSNRDERLTRKPALPPEVHTVNGITLLFPQDADAGGTWIACKKSGRSVCLLNGAFQPHIPQPPYRKSRGLVVLDFFTSPSAADFEKNYDLTGIEPFTMVIAEGGRLEELRWDGHRKYFIQLDAAIPHIHSSATLYTPETMALRKKWFDSWLSTHQVYEVGEILRFHQFAGEGDEATNVRMSRFGLVETVSITCISVQNDNVQMFYADVSHHKNADFEVYAFNDNAISNQSFFTAR
jgi:Transport and Golgi organisation 2